MNIKLVVTFVLVGVLAVFVVGLVSAQIASPTPNGATTNGVTSNGFFGWMVRCLGSRGAPYYETETPAFPQQALNITVTDPNTNTTPSFQGHGMPFYPRQPQKITATNPNAGTTPVYQGTYGYIQGGCMRGFNP
jgi:hypothetical protein